MVSDIYSDRTFRVVEGSAKSDWERQQAGIAQGCPLSSFLISIVMTVVLFDVERGLANSVDFPSARSHIHASTSLYAIDTMLVHDDTKAL